MKKSPPQEQFCKVIIQNSTRWRTKHKTHHKKTTCRNKLSVLPKQCHEKTSSSRHIWTAWSLSSVRHRQRLVYVGQSTVRTIEIIISSALTGGRHQSVGTNDRAGHKEVKNRRKGVWKTATYRVRWLLRVIICRTLRTSSATHRQRVCYLALIKCGRRSTRTGNDRVASIANRHKDNNGVHGASAERNAVPSSATPQQTHDLVSQTSRSITHTRASGCEAAMSWAA